jgi:hypothetical protein
MPSSVRSSREDQTTAAYVSMLRFLPNAY